MLRMESPMENVVGCLVMVAITFPVAFFVARSCLRGVIRVVTGGSRHELRPQS